MKMNPVYKKELQINVRSIKLPVMIIFFNMMLTLIGLVIFYDIISLTEIEASISYSSAITLYQLLVIIEFSLLVFVVPAVTAGGISGERERQTLDILLSSRLTPANIILGKLASSVNTMILLIISGLPVISLIFIFGGVTFRDVLTITIYLVFVTFFVGTLGIVFSTAVKRTTSATVLTYGSILFFCLGTLLLTAMLVFVIRFQNPEAEALAGAGWTLIILLLNPVITLLELLERQVGVTFDLFDWRFGMEIPLFLKTHWIILSIMLQSVLTGVLLYFSCHQLDPLKKKKAKSLKR